MAIILTLILTTLAARAVGLLGVESLDTWPDAIALGLAAMFVMTGVAHFVNPLRRDMITIVPARLPHPATLVTVTGVLELLGAVGLLIPATRVAAAGCLFVLMIAMFPANVRAARMSNPPKSMNTPLPLRSAEQALFLAAALIVTLGGVQ